MRNPLRGAPDLLAAVCVLTAGLVGGCAATPGGTPGPPAFTCCAASVTAQVWRPGQQIRLTWTELRVPQEAGQRTTLKAVLTGPYRTVAALKAASANGGSARARVVDAAAVLRVPARPASRPVSVVSLPADLPAGLYNLQFSASSDGVTAGWSSVISVG
ncbi:MAG TPA: hypothetical protein VEH05_17970 [Streptosporangiaceae bacterium]|nr:hypothetical protein [Streptosporangiaceae bacterium]